ncbi:hypothetical protein RJ639_035101 [Escallonia herrerae]|uniref:Uncharacterized protein n=1 Tax=Escallonia herrerae TaxID=1293975 RepID=A0AA88X2A1_9ASTE|nr:hypothetical protein RJ639_035101 [Escallonia herrerae]
MEFWVSLVMLLTRLESQYFTAVYERLLLWLSFCLTKLIEAAELPFKGDDLDTPITSVPGMESFLRRRDLPTFCRSGDLSDPSIQLFKTEIQELPRAHGLILNTMEHFLWKEDRSCITWLDSQPSKSVIYISFGSLAVITKDQHMEFWHGVVNSGTRFLWVIRPDSIAGGDSGSNIPVELSLATKERGYIVGWAAQEEVLAHAAIGGFLTHSGWNSTLESLMEGVPMICWPYFLD